MALILPKGLPVINKLLDEGIDVIYKEDFIKFFNIFITTSFTFSC